MTAKVIPFPDRSEPNLSEIEQLIRSWLLNIAEDPEFVEQVAGRMMSFIQGYANKWFEPAFNLVVPPTLSLEERKALWRSIETGVDETARQVQEMINRIIVERFFLEVELYERREQAAYPKRQR